MGAFDIRSTEIIIDLQKCSFENGTEFANVGCIKDNKSKENISGYFNVSDLAPGTLNNICISACGENLTESDDLLLTKYTSKILFITSNTQVLSSDIITSLCGYSSVSEA